MAYQIAFDLEESATQEFLQKVSSELPDVASHQEKRDSEAMETDESEIQVCYAYRLYNKFVYILSCT